MHTYILNIGIVSAALCAATLFAQGQPVYTDNTQPQITAKLAVGDASHSPTPDGRYILLASMEGVVVAQRNQTDNQGRPVIKTFLPHPRMTHYIYFFETNRQYVATFGDNQLRIFQWTSNPEAHTGTIYNITSAIASSNISSIGAIHAYDGEGGRRWLVVLGSVKPSKIYLFSINGTLVKSYDDHGGSGVFVIASDPFHGAKYTRVATAGDGGSVTIWKSSGDINDPLVIDKKLYGGRTTLTDISFVPTYDKGFVGFGLDRRFYYWDITTQYPTPKHVYNLADDLFRALKISFSPSGYAILPAVFDAYWFEIPTSANPNRFRFVGKRRIVDWDFYSLSWITSYGLATPPVSILDSANMLASYNNAYMVYKEAPWNVCHSLGSPPLATCATNAGVAAVTTVDRRVFIYRQNYLQDSTTPVASNSLPLPAHSIAYLGHDSNEIHYFIAGAGDGKLLILTYNSLSNTVNHSGVISTPADMRGALLLDTVRLGSQTMVVVGSPTDGNVLIYRWQQSTPTTLQEWDPISDSDKISVGYVIRDLRATRLDESRYHIGGAIRKYSHFTAVHDGGFSGRPTLGSAGDGQSFDWNPTNPNKFALIRFRSRDVIVDSQYRPEIGSGFYNVDIPWQIRYNDGSSVAISYRHSVHCFRAQQSSDGVQFVRSERIVPERTGTFTSIATQFMLGNHGYWVLGDTNGTVSFALPEALQQVQEPISISFAYNYAYARFNFYTLSHQDPNSTNNRFAAIAYSGVSPREPRTHILRLNEPNPAGYKVEKVLQGHWFLCPTPNSSGQQWIHTVVDNQTRVYNLNDVLTSPTPLPLQTITGIHERFSYNGNYCVVQNSDTYYIYKRSGSSWTDHGSIPASANQFATKCYISDTGNYAVVLQDRYDNSINRYVKYCNIYAYTSGNWTLQHSLSDREYLVFNVDHGAGEYGDYLPFVFLPGSDWFCINYNRSAPTLLLVDAAHHDPINHAIDLGLPSYTFGFVVSGTDKFLLRLATDPNNVKRLAVYNISNPTNPIYVRDFQREVNLSYGFPQPIVGNYGFGMFNHSTYGVIFNLESSP